MTSQLELLLSAQIADARLPEPEREFRFHRVRKWRFDFAWPDYHLAVEVEGGIWSQGRHTRGQGFIQDCFKYNAAALQGWRVLRFPAELINSGTALATITRALQSTPIGDLGLDRPEDRQGRG